MDKYGQQKTLNFDRQLVDKNASENCFPFARREFPLI